MFTYTKEIVKQSIEATLERVKPYHQNVLRRIEEMSPGQKRKMASLFTHPCNFDDAIFFCDMTMFGSGKKGFVITKDAVYFTREFMKYPDSNVEIRTQVLSFAYMLRVDLGHDGAHKYIDIEFLINNRHQRARYYLSGKEDFFVAILKPVVELRWQAERREREEKERIRKEELKAEIERIDKKWEEESRLYKERKRAREKETLALVEKAVQDRPGNFRYISVIHDIFEHEGKMYCLAETVSNLGDLDVFLVFINREGVLELIQRDSIQKLKDEYWKYMKSLKN